MTMLLDRGRLLRARHVHLYTACESATATLVYLIVVFSPWAFGTTQPWSIWTMNAAGYLLGILLVLKLIIRHAKGFRPPRWDHESAAAVPEQSRPVFLAAHRLTGVLFLMAAAILLYSLISALNAATTYEPRLLAFAYHHYASWLPHSFDSSRTWLAFWNYLALACSFWAVKDWLAGKSGGEERAGRQPCVRSHMAVESGVGASKGLLSPALSSRGGEGGDAAGLPGEWPGPRTVVRSHGSATLFPARLRGLLWVLCINGALVGVESIAQRLEASGRLLFLIKPAINAEAISQFGPYHYRANAAAYFNLIWPVCLGFWWTLHRSADSRDKRHHLLLLCSVIMAACPIISTSRGGALITFGMLGLLSCLFIASHFERRAHREQDRRKRDPSLGFLLLFFAGTMTLGLALGWKTLSPRLAQIDEGFAAREQMYQAAWPMAADYPLFGTGPGTFESVFQLYRVSTETYWPAQLHNDWLETRITFGWAGSSLIALALVTILLRWFAPGAVHGGRRFMIFQWLALAGCLIHARFDFPFQIYSILFLFLLLCAVAFNLSRRP